MARGERWRQGRLGVALPLAAAVVLFLAALHAVDRRAVEHDALRSESAASLLAVSTQERLQKALLAVEALHGAMIAAGGPLSEAAFDGLANTWRLHTPGLLLFGWHESEFVSRMSHELRTPLNGILGFSQLIERRASPQLDAQAMRWVQRIYACGEHLLSMVDDLLDLSRMDANTIVLDIGPHDIGSIAAESASLMEAQAERAEVRLRLHPTDHAVNALGDRTRIRQILLNLLTNAIKYNVPGGEVDLRYSLVDARHVSIEVRDTGIGMDAVQLAALFQPYNRLGREHTSTEGTGIGLVIAKSLAERMGGSLTAASAKGCGAPPSRSCFPVSGHKGASQPLPRPRIRRRVPYRRRPTSGDGKSSMPTMTMRARK